MINQVIQQRSNSEASVESLQDRRFWLQCERAYTYQPIYRTDGRLLAVELLTVVTHPDNPTQRIAPDRYFAGVAVRHRIDIVKEQLQLLEQKTDFFQRHELLASNMVQMIERMPWLRFELVEHIHLPKESSFASMCEFGPLWLDDFGTGMANFSALNEVRYDYIKVARELFVMLRQTPEGRNLFTMLLQLMNRYCRGVIVEGVETLEEWRDVQRSPAFAAQGYFLSRPVPFACLDEVILSL